MNRRLDSNSHRKKEEPTMLTTRADESMIIEVTKYCSNLIIPGLSALEVKDSAFDPIILEADESGVHPTNNFVI